MIGNSMTSLCPMVWLLMFVSSVATAVTNSTWNPEDCIFDCKCELLNKRKTFTCTNKNLTITPVNGFPLPLGAQVVDLSFNMFHVLRENAFNQFYPDRGMNELLVMNISRNHIQRIAVNAFKYIDNLTKLDLSYNKIDRLTPLTFQNMSNLRELHLHHNLIKTLEEFTFKGLNNLKVLDLSFCRLSHISWWAFSFSKFPKLLNLEHNNLTTFHSNYIYSPRDFEGTVKLTDNPIICDCELERIFDDSYGIIGKYNLTCSDPEHFGLQLTSLEPADFQACGWTFILPTLNHTVETVASSTTVLACRTIAGPLFKNWTTQDGRNVSVWPDRFVETRSATWVNLTITDTQTSDEGEYTCSVYERVSGSLRSVSHTISLVVEEPDVSLEEEGRGNNGTNHEHGETDDNPTLWLVLGITAILVVFFGAVMFIAVRNKLRSNESLRESTSEPLARNSHTYEDVDAVLLRLAQRPLPLPLPLNQEYAKVGATPQYLQHCMAVRSPFALPVSSSMSSVSTLNQSERSSRIGPYDNELYLQPVTSKSQGQLNVDNNNKYSTNLKYIAVLPTYADFTSDNK